MPYDLKWEKQRKVNDCFVIIMSAGPVELDILSAYLSDESIYLKNVKVRDDFVTWSSLGNKENSRTVDPWRLSVSFAEIFN